MSKTKLKSDIEKKKFNGIFGKKNDLVYTPKPFYDELDKEFGFDFDPCPIDPQFDGLKAEWGKCNFVNPPYSSIPKWIEKGIKECKKGKKCVFLVPIRPNSKYWANNVYKNVTSIRYISPIVFQGYDTPLRIPLCLLIFDPLDEKHTSKFEHVQKSTYNYFEHK